MSDIDKHTTRRRSSPGSYAALVRLGRVQLSTHFYMRNFLASEIGNFHGLPNLPDDPDLAIAAGRSLARELLEPLVATFGPIEIRSGYRSAAINGFGNARGLQCARNHASAAEHIWDRRDAAGRMGATATVVIPWFAAQYRAGRDWRDLAHWLDAHLPYHAIRFFPVNAAFNLGWREAPQPQIASYIAPRGWLRRPGAAPLGAPERWCDFPTFQGLALPAAVAQPPLAEPVPGGQSGARGHKARQQEP